MFSSVKTKLLLNLISLHRATEASFKKLKMISNIADQLSLQTSLITFDF